ncbi:c-type cytochrome [Azomonas macrocytogenes]|uniref:Cytochrome c553 n=1 Tax=Azomonas macrocytogenes TaxID=69962 RepID=A0A839T484_AZOMA|nr:c-type cytochrome [Azomonas macrocytogenes]MBB3104232.1 cytochrome c553 [Azomonas macrocytogenes]
MLPRFVERFLTPASGPLRALRWLLLGLALAIGGLLVAWSGVIPIAASSGHWPITDWFLHFAMRSAVRTQSLGISAPDLDDPALVLKGAGHYASACTACHGAPGEAQSLVVQYMTPPPPLLAPRIKEWQPEELFWIVKHGVKFTAMPAWPAQERDDEIWAMVAFLRTLPELDPASYAWLANGTDAKSAINPLQAMAGPQEAVLADCARCHGSDGNGRNTGLPDQAITEPLVPKLAGQSEAYLLASLQAYARGERHSGIMQPVAVALDEATMQALARHYASLPPSAEAARDEQAIARGRTLAAQGRPEQGTPSCLECHGPTATVRNPFYPDLAGQYATYLTAQLKLFSTDQRGGTQYAHLMQHSTQRMNDIQMEDLARYYESLQRN